MHIGYAELRTLTITIITPRMQKWLLGFNLDLALLELRDKDYIAIQPISRDCIQHYFVVNAISKGAVKLKSKKLELRLIMPYATFLTIEEYWNAPRHLVSTTSTSQVWDSQSQNSMKIQPFKSREKGKGKGKQIYQVESDGESSEGLPGASGLTKVFIDIITLINTKVFHSR